MSTIPPRPDQVKTPAPFAVDARVIVEYGSRWGGGVTAYKFGKVAKLYKNGNFVLHFDGDPALDKQQWSGYGAFLDRTEIPRAIQTGGGYGGVRCYPDWPEVRKDMQAQIDGAKLRTRLSRVKDAVHVLKSPDGSVIADFTEMDGLVGALESALGLRKGGLKPNG